MRITRIPGAVMLRGATEGTFIYQKPGTVGQSQIRPVVDQVVLTLKPGAAFDPPSVNVLEAYTNDSGETLVVAIDAAGNLEAYEAVEVIQSSGAVLRYVDEPDKLEVSTETLTTDRAQTHPDKDGTLAIDPESTGDSLETIVPLLNGAIVETINIDVIEDTGVVKLQLEAQGGGDLTVFFGGMRYTFDATPTAEVNLTAGTDIAPQINYTYLTESGGTVSLNNSTVGFPATSHAPVATTLVQSSSGVATDGAYKVHAWTDHLSSSTENGHLAHLNKKLRALQATWDSGVAPADLVTVSTDAYLSVASGVIFQLHTHAFPARDMQTGDPLFVVNEPSTAYLRVTTLDTLTQDADGNALLNKYFNVVLWGVVSEDATDCKIMLNLPHGTYNVQADADDDTDQTADYVIPGDFIGTGFLIARYTLRKTAGGWSQSNKVDLRGLVPSTSIGGGGITDHGGLAGLSDDDHTQYIFDAPTTSTRNVINSTSDIVLLVLERETAETGSDAFQYWQGTELTKLAWITGAGKMFAQGFDATSDLITNVSDGVSDTDAATVGQLNTAQEDAEAFALFVS